MKRYCQLFISIIILFASRAKAQEHIQYRIINDTVLMSKERPILRFNIRLTNYSEINLLLYGFRNAFLVAPELDSAQIIRASKMHIGGNRLFLTQDKDRAKIWENISSVHDQDLTGSFQEIRNILVKNSLENLEILNGGYSKEIEVIVDLFDYGPLKRGVYNFYLIYSSGSLTEEVLEGILKQNEAKYNALTFSGYVVSNEATLVIN